MARLNMDLMHLRAMPVPDTIQVLLDHVRQN